MPEIKINKQEKQKVKELLDELTELGPQELSDWNIKARMLLVFIAMRNPDLVIEANKWRFTILNTATIAIVLLSATSATPAAGLAIQPIR